MNKDFPKPVAIALFYDKDLQKITKTASEETIVNEGMPFILLLSFVFKSYPEIEKQYPPGTLGLLLNGKPPQDFDIIQNGDRVELYAFKSLFSN